MHDLLIKNINVVNSAQEVKTHIALKNGKISAVSNQECEAQTTIEGEGLTCLYGAMDSQVHFREPGLTHKEDIEHGSKGAALGGITHFLEMPNTTPPTTSAQAIAEKVAIAKEKAVTHFGFFMGGTAENLEQLKKAHEVPGCCGVKIFLGSSTGDLLLYDEEKLFEIFSAVKTPIALHSEDELLLRERLPYRAVNKRAHDHPIWRNVETALRSTQKVISIARKAKKKIHILHISTQEEIEFLAQNKDICTVEVLPQHLTLHAPDCYDQLGSYAQMNPPIREKRHQEALWRGIENGTVDVMGSDHAPHTKKEKDRGYPNTPSGMPGVQTLLPIMLDHVNQGRLSLARLSELLCERPYELYNMANKGKVEVGFDADLTLVDMNKTHTFTNEEMVTKSGWTPYRGKTVQGMPVATIVAGKVVMREGKLL